MNVNQRMFDTFDIHSRPVRLGVVLLVGKSLCSFVCMDLHHMYMC